MSPSAGSSSPTRSSTARARSTRSPRVARSATRCSRASRSAPSSPRRSRCSRGPATRRRGCGRRPPGWSTRSACPTAACDGYLEHDLPAARRAAGAARHERHGLDGGRAVRARRGGGRARRGGGDRAQRVVPQRARPAWTSAPTRRRSQACSPRSARGRAKPLIVKLTPNTADVAAVAGAARGRGRGRRVAHQHAAGLRPGARRGRPAGARVAGRRDRRAVRSGGPRGRPGAGPRGRRDGSRSRSSAWAAIQTAEHAAQFLAAGATLVAVGTESFRDPLAASHGSPRASTIFSQRAGTSRG